MKLLLCLCPLLLVTAMVVTAEDKPATPSVTVADQQVVWRQGKMGAGGFVTGIDIHPSGELMLCRTDVGGAYKWDDAGKQWVQIATTERLPEGALGFFEYDGVSSLVSAPSDVDRLYMAFCGRIYASDDRGETWRAGVLDGADKLVMDPNARVGRLQGERLAVDPKNKDIAYYGSNADGLWVTKDGGKRWIRVDGVPAGVPAQPKKKKAAPIPVGLGSVLFDPSTAQDGSPTRRALATVWGEGVYETTDAGATWKRTGADLGISEVESAAMGNDGTYVVAQSEARNAFRLRDGHWEELKLPRKEKWIEVVIKPGDSNTMFLFGSGVMGFARQLRTTDGGATWTPIAHKTLIAEDIPWLAKEAFFSTGAVRFDPKTDRLWIAQGVGVWYSDDALTANEITWNSRSAGIEELVVNDIVVPEPGQPVIANWDRPIIKSEHVDKYPATWGPVEEFGSAWDIDAMASNPRSMVGIFQGQANNPHAGVGLSGYSDDGGRTWTPFAFEKFPFDIHDPHVWVYGNIAVSSQDPNKIVWFTVGQDGRFLHTADRGKTWEESEFEGGVPKGSWNRASYFYKQAVVADPLKGDVFYAYNWTTKNLYRSEDGGKTFRIAGRVPSELGNYHCKLRAVPGESGHLFFANGLNNDKFTDTGMGPLYESKDGGATWTQVPNTEKIIDIAFGAPAPGSDFPTWYVSGQMTGADGPLRGIFRSIDRGATWERISGPYPMGVSKHMSTLAADPGIYGRVYLGTSGIGYFYSDLE